MVAVVESFRAQVERVISMSEGDETWDLSPNDCLALKAVLQRMAVLDERAQSLLAALKLAESVYRLNVVAVGEPSSVLDAMQAAIRHADDND